MCLGPRMGVMLHLEGAGRVRGQCAAERPTPTRMVAYAMGFKWGVGTRSIWEKMTSVRIGSIFPFSGSPAQTGHPYGPISGLRTISVGPTGTSEQSAGKEGRMPRGCGIPSANVRAHSTRSPSK